jgi:N-dimethylarginine dimethylaminohydrolase
MITTLPVSPSARNLASLPHFNRPTYLMCPPEWYDVDYVINPWMAGNIHQPSRDTAFMQWKNLYQELQRIADVRLLHAREGAPDMVFVAHAAVVQHGVAAVSSFTHPQRQTEERHVRQWLEDAGFLIWATPRETSFEGEGDALFDANGAHLWAGHGVRTCKISSRKKNEVAYPADKRIVVSELEATQFACNVINAGRNILMGAVGTDLRERLMERGFDVIELVLGEFQRGGGSAKALALRLSDMNVTHGAKDSVMAARV